MTDFILFYFLLFLEILLQNTPHLKEYFPRYNTNLDRPINLIYPNWILSNMEIDSCAGFWKKMILVKYFQ